MDCDDGWLPLRLTVVRSSILHRELGLAVLDAYEETQFGRDVAPLGIETPRIRLKEMEVSKVHATVFWDKTRREWAVVDMGSKHGTFIQPAQHPDAELVRLSPARMASVPRPLHHLDRLIIGSTTFVCHIHADHTPCAECTLSGQGVLPLFSVPREDHGAEKRPREATEETRDAKRALTSLKHTLLARHPPPSTPPTSYVDRSARRRAMHPSSRLDSPGVRSPRSRSPSPPNLLPTPPFPEHNIGRRLLVKQGWAPGTSLGAGGGLTEPVVVHAMAHRAGIGHGGEWTARRWRLIN